MMMRVIDIYNFLRFREDTVEAENMNLIMPRG